MPRLLENVRARRAGPSPAMARAIREAARVSQREMAEELGVHPITVARWEGGTRTPRGDMARRYAELLEALRQVGAA